MTLTMNPHTGATRRYQTPRSIERRIVKAYDAMARKADLHDAKYPGGWTNLCGGPAYERLMRARGHALICKEIAA